MPPSVYIETSIVSYLVARPSRDVIMAERQRQTREWWTNHRGEYRLFSSESVLYEVGRGEAAMARMRAASLNHIPLLRTRTEVEDLAEALITDGPLPDKAKSDAIHIALAAVSGLDYLLTWNCRHIANPRMYPTITRLCRERGYVTPVLCTPAVLLRR
ncbi:MAG TPA: type II toxin-antitoxin system VapC family toxin [Longimicrobium sp.]|jgi:predicted nucleic acid-binding protein